MEPLKFDEEAIQQDLFNLLINSVQAIDQQGKIEICLAKSDLKSRSYASAQTAVETMRKGAYDYLIKPSGEGSLCCSELCRSTRDLARKRAVWA